MSDLIVFSNRGLCREDFLERVEKVAAAGPKAIVLREKDLPEEAYQALAQQVLAICKAHGTCCILHNYVEAAKTLGSSAVHLPLPVLRGLTLEERQRFTILGASCHSVADALEAEQLGCTYITAGHVFETDCKKGLPGRGLIFLQEVAAAVSIPVYGIGGIAPENIGEVRKAGASGACIMSGAMTCDDVSEYLKAFE